MGQENDLSDEEFPKSSELSPAQRTASSFSPQKGSLGWEPCITLEPLCPTSQLLHASSTSYFHSKKPQLLFIILFSPFASHHHQKQTECNTQSCRATTFSNNGKKKCMSQLAQVQPQAICHCIGFMVLMSLLW